MEQLYAEIIPFFGQGINLQTAIPIFEDYPDFENRFFKGHLHNQFNAFI